MSLEQGIMGFLSMKPLSGYDIKKLFDMSAAYFWPANQSQIYRTLKQLCKDGLVELKEQKKGETVDRKVYAITENGRREYLPQIQQNTVADFISRDSFLVQLYFFGALDRAEPRFRSAMWAYDWELIKCKDYAKFLKTIKRDLQSIRTDTQK